MSKTENSDQLSKYESLITELLAIDSPRSGLPEPDCNWHDQEHLFPEHLCRTKVVNEQQTKVTFMFSTSEEEAVRNFYQKQKPGFKQQRGFERNKGTNCLSSLGRIPEGVIDNWERDVFPPSLESARLICQTVDMHSKALRKTMRRSHIEREEQSGACSFSCNLRRLSVGDVSIITFDKNQCVHTCARQKLELLPLTREEHRFILKVLETFPDIKEAMVKVFRPAQEKCEREGLSRKRLAGMTQGKLGKYAKKARIQHDVPPGE